MTTKLEFIPANDKQKLFMESKARYILMSGAVGAGKSYMGIWKGFLLNLLYPGNRGLICRKEFSSLKASTMITLFEKVIPQDMIISYDKIDGVLKHKTGVPGVYSFISFSGLDKKADQQYPTKVGSTEYGWIFADETTELTEDDWQVLATRLRHKPSIVTFNKCKTHLNWPKKLSYKMYCDQMVRQLFGATNPDSPHHYLYKFFFEHTDDLDRQLILTTPYDNPYLDEDYIKALEATLTGIRRDRLLHGKWVQAEGIIYDCFDMSKNLIDYNPEKDVNKYKSFFGGADSNFPTPRAGLLMGEDASKGELHILDEYYIPNSHPEDLGKWFSEFAFRYTKNVEVFHDPADPDAIAKINYFSMLTCEKANNKVIPGIDAVYSMLKTGRLKINRRCKHLIKYLQTYSWKKGATDQPVKKDDHLPDALRYAVFTWKNTYETSSGESNNEETFIPFGG